LLWQRIQRERSQDGECERTPYGGDHVREHYCSKRTPIFRIGEEAGLIRVENLYFQYKRSDRLALNGVNLEVKPGEFVGITGPTGAGKTTLINCLNGIIPHFTRGLMGGAVYIDGMSTASSTVAELSAHVGTVFQDPEGQIVSTRVDEEIAFGLENIGLERDLMHERITEALEMIGIGHLRHRTTAELSGGQKQRVAMAAALAMRPKILLLDEPTAELDPLGTRDVFASVTKLNREHGVTIVLVEHEMEYLAIHCDRLLIMCDGEIVCDDRPSGVFGREELLAEVGVRMPQVARLINILRQEKAIPQRRHMQAADAAGTNLPLDLNTAAVYVRSLLSH